MIFIEQLTIKVKVVVVVVVVYKEIKKYNYD
jgi:hypothetical protein